MLGLKGNVSGVKRSRSIDGLRGVMALLIVTFHTDEAYGSHYFSTGYLAVEFFFILSGFLLMRGLSNIPEIRADISVIPARIFMHKWKHFFALNLLCVLILHTWYFYQNSGQSFSFYFTSLFDRMGEIFFLQCSGLPLNLVNWPAWYLSALLLGSYILSALYCMNRKVFQFLTPMLAVTIYACLIRTAGSVGTWYIVFAGFVNSGLLRGLAGLSLGCTLYSAFCLMSFACVKESLSRRQASFLNIIELLSLGVLARLLIRWFPSGNDIWALPCFCLVILLAFFDLGIIARILKTKCFVFLGSISFEIYLSHWFLLQIVKKYLIHIPFFIMWPALLVAVICYAALLFYVVEPLFRKAGRFATQYFNFRELPTNREIEV